MPGGVFGFLHQPERDAVVLHPGPVRAMIRSTSSDTLAIFANASTSDSLTFGLLKTAAATIRFESRISWARCSRVPFVASFKRATTGSDDSIAADGSSVSGSSTGPSSARSSCGSAVRLAGVAKRLDAPKSEELAHGIGHVRACEEMRHGRLGQLLQRHRRQTCDARILVVEQDHQQRDLFQRVQPQESLRAGETDVALRLVAAEHLQERRAIP